MLCFADGESGDFADVVILNFDMQGYFVEASSIAFSTDFKFSCVSLGAARFFPQFGFELGIGVGIEILVELLFRYDSVAPAGGTVAVGRIEGE